MAEKITANIVRIAYKASDIAKVKLVDTDLVLVLKNGKQLFFRDGAIKSMLDPSLKFVLLDGELLAADLLKMVGDVEVDTQTATSGNPSDKPVAGTALSTGSEKNGDNSSELAQLRQKLDQILNMQDESRTAYLKIEERVSDLIAQSGTVPSPAVTPTLASASPAPAPEASKGFFASLSPAWGALGALGALGAAGGGGAAASALSSLNIAGAIMLGPVKSGNGLRVQAYDRDGNLLGTAETVDPVTGAYKMTLTSVSAGVIILKLVDGSVGVGDYMDEATAQVKSLDAVTLRAVVTRSSTENSLTVNLNPLTELAAYKMGVVDVNGKPSYGGTADTATQINKQMAKLLGLGDGTTSVIAIEVKPTIKDDGTPAADANAAGKLLAQISEAEKTTFLSTNQMVVAMADQIAQDSKSVTTNGTTTTTIELSFKSAEVANAATPAQALVSTAQEIPPNVTSLRLLRDTDVDGKTNTDLISSDSGTDQTVTVTLDKVLPASKTLYVKAPGGSWVAASASPLADGRVGYSASTGALVSSGNFEFKILNSSDAQPQVSAGQVPPLSQGVSAAYTFDADSPGVHIVGVTMLNVAADGTGRFVANKAAQTLAFNLSNPLTGSGTDVVQLWGSLDGGSTWTNLSLLSQSGLPDGSGNTVLISGQSVQWNTTLELGNFSAEQGIQMRVTDLAGNQTVSGKTAYTYDNVAPQLTAGQPSAELVEAGGVQNSLPGVSTSIVKLSASDNLGSVSLSADLIKAGWALSGDGKSYTMAGTYGRATLTLADITYTLNNNLQATQSLRTGDKVTDSFGIIVVDAVGNTAQSTVTFSINGTNDAVAISPSGSPARYTENGSATRIDGLIQIAGDDAKTSDLNARLDSGIKVSISQNFSTGDVLSMTPIGSITSSYDQATGVLTLTGSDTLANYQTALRSVSFSSTSANPTLNAKATSRTISWALANQAGAQSTAVTSILDITPINDAPQLSVVETNTFTEAGGPKVLDGMLKITDADDTQMAGATVTIRQVVTGDTLSFTPKGNISGSYNVGTGVLSLSGVDSIDNYQTVLRSVQYTTTSVDPSVNDTRASRSIDWQVQDANSSLVGTKTSTVVTGQITVKAINNAPSITAGATASFTESGDAVAIDNTITIADSDDTSMSRATVKISQGLTSGDVLSFVSVYNITGSYDGTTGILTLTGNATKTEYASALRNVKFNSTAQIVGASTSSRTIDWSVTDANSDNVGEQTSNHASSIINLTSFNDPATLTKTGGQVTYFEKAAAVTIVNSIRVEDIDSEMISGATVRVAVDADPTSNSVAGDVLSFSDTVNISGTYNSNTGILTLTGNDTKANYQDALRKVKFSSSSDDPTVNGTIPTRVVTWSVTDADQNAQSSALLTSVINITARNNAPVLESGVSTVSLTYNERASAQSLLADIAVSDADDTQLRSATVTIRSGLTTEDLLEFTSPNGSGISGSYDANSGRLTLSGVADLIAYQNALRSVTFRNTGNNPTSFNSRPARILDWVVTDANSDGAGEQASALLSSSINVTVSNDKPTLALIFPSSSYTERAAARLVLDVTGTVSVTDDDDTSMSAATVRITEGFTAGDVLRVNASSGINSSYDDMTGVLSLYGVASKLAYQNVLKSLNFSSTSHDPTAISAQRTFAWTVTDASSGGTTGITEQTSEAVTQVITVTAVNDMPVVSPASGARVFNQGTDTEVLVNHQILVSDADDTQLTGATVQIGSPVAGDTLAMSASVNGIAATYDAIAGLLTLTGTASVSDYVTALQSVKYSTTAADPTSGGGRNSRTINWAVTDANSDGVGAATSLAASSTLQVFKNNTAPVVVLTPLDAVPVYAEAGPASGGVAVALMGNIAITDDDSQMIQATVWISEGTLTPGDVLSVVPTSPLISVQYDAGYGALFLNGKALASSYASTLQAVKFSSTSANPTAYGTASTRTLHWTVVDQRDAVSLETTSKLNITPAANAPSLSVGDLQGYTSGNPSQFLNLGTTAANSLSLSDLDDTFLTAATVTLGHALDSDVLSWTLPAGSPLNVALSTYDPNTDSGQWVITITGKDTLVNYQALLRSIQYRNSSQDPALNLTKPDRTLTWTVTDFSSGQSGSGGLSTTTTVGPKTFSVADTIAPDAPTAVMLTPSGGTVVANTLNTTNTALAIGATIEAGQATGGRAEFWVGDKLKGEDTVIGDTDTRVSFTTADADPINTELQAAIAAGGVVRVKLFDKAGNGVFSSENNPTLRVDYTAPTTSPTAVLQAGSDLGYSQTDGLTSQKRPSFTVTSGPGEQGATIELFNDSNDNNALDQGELLGSVTLGASSSTGTLTVVSDMAEAIYNRLKVRQFDAAGNLSTATPTALAALQIKTIVPSFNSVAISGTDANGVDKSGTLLAGDKVRVLVTGSEALFVTGTPTYGITLDQGLVNGAPGTHVLRQATYESGSGTNSLVFTYAIAIGDGDTSTGVTSVANAMTLGTGNVNVTSRAGALANLSSLPAANANNIVIGADNTAPTVRGVQLSNTTNAIGPWLNLNDEVYVNVNFSENVVVTGTPLLYLSLESPAGGVPARYVSGTGTSSLKFKFVVAEGNTDTNGISIGVNALRANDGTHGTITDGSNNIASLAHSEVTDNANYKIDTTAPAVSSTVITGTNNLGVAKSSSNTTPLGIGDLVKVTIGFNDDLKITGTPTFAIKVNGVTRTATYSASASSASSLVFFYPIAANDAAASGQVTAESQALTGLTDLAGNAFTGSVSAVVSSAVAISTSGAPDATIMNLRLSADTAPTGTPGDSDLWSDFITKTATQTISGTLSRVLGATETVQISLDNGKTWNPVTTATVGSNFFSHDVTTLSGSSTLQVRVINNDDNKVGTAYSHTFTVDGAINNSFDPGLSVTTTPTLSGTTDPNATVKVAIDANGLSNDGYEVFYTTTANDKGNWSVKVGTDTVAASSVAFTAFKLGDGTAAADTGARMKVTATDVAGNTAEVVKVASVSNSTYSISNASVIEGSLGTKKLVFMVTREGDLSSTGSVDYAVNDAASSAKNTGLLNGDFSEGSLYGWAARANGGTAPTYDATAGAVSFANADARQGGTLSQTFTTVKDQTYTVAWDQVGTAPLQVSVTGTGPTTYTNASQSESKTYRFTATGTSTTLTFTDASTDVGVGVTIDNIKVPGSVSTNSDYKDLNASKTLSFAPGEANKLLAFDVTGDYYKEINDTLQVNLSAPVNGGLLTSYGTGTIQELDPTRMQVAYSLRDINPLLDTKAIRVRATNGAETDIGFDAYGQIDTAAMSAFASVNASNNDQRLFVTMWYDQSGNIGANGMRRDLVQTNAASQGVIMRSDGRFVTRSDGSVGISFNDGLNGNTAVNGLTPISEGDMMSLTDSTLAGSSWTNVQVILKTQSNSLSSTGIAFNLAVGGRITAFYGAQGSVYFDSNTSTADGNGRLSGGTMTQGLAHDLVFESHVGNRGNPGTAALNYTDAAINTFIGGMSSARAANTNMRDTTSTTANWTLAAGRIGNATSDYYQNLIVSEFMAYVSTANQDSTAVVNSLGGGLGNDVLTYAGESSVTKIDGGLGLDVLYLSGAVNLDLSSLMLQNVEQIWAVNGAANTITLTSVSMESNGAPLLISMDIGDQVSFDGDNFGYSSTAQTLYLGTTGHDTLVSSPLNDKMIGRGGADTYKWLATQSGTDTVMDFNPNMGASQSKLNIAALLEGYGGGANIDNWVTIVEGGGKTTLIIDVDGYSGAKTETQIIVLQGVTGIGSTWNVSTPLSAQEWVNHGLLVVL